MQIPTDITTSSGTASAGVDGQLRPPAPPAGTERAVAATLPGLVLDVGRDVLRKVCGLAASGVALSLLGPWTDARRPTGHHLTPPSSGRRSP
jgi:hypothetical protein